MSDTERRAFAGIELRKNEKGEHVIAGHAAVFEKMSHDLGGFREKIAPGAFTRTLKSGNDVLALVNHDPNFRLGRTKNGTVRLREDQDGLAIEIDPPNTQTGRDTVEDIRTGNLDGMSFMFRTIEDDWSIEGGEEIRTLKQIELLEAGPVTFPAYPDTSVAVRSLNAIKEKRCHAPADEPEANESEVDEVTDCDLITADRVKEHLDTFHARFVLAEVDHRLATRS